MFQKCLTSSCRCFLKMNNEKSEVEVKTLCTFNRIFIQVMVLTVMACPASPEYVRGSASRDWKNKEDLAKMPMPEFENTNTHVSVSLGRVAFLPCKVRNISDKVVSWIRTRDLHILTTGPYTFTADSRFESSHTSGSANWGLRLRNSQISDSGTYECQVNTDPKMNRKVTLEVDINMGDSPYNDIESHMADDLVEEGLKKGGLTKILGRDEQYVNTGSTMTFTCLVVSTEQVPSSVEWLKNGRQVSFQASRGGISVDTERSEKRTISRLTLADISSDDSGNYTCKPSQTKPHSVALIVVEGEHTQAMQRKNSCARALESFSLLLLCAWVASFISSL